MNRQLPIGNDDEAMALCDAQGIVLDVNRGFAEGLGVSEVACVGQPLELSLPANARELFLADLRGWALEGKASVGVVTQWFTILDCCWELSLEKIPEGESWRVLCTLRRVGGKRLGLEFGDQASFPAKEGEEPKHLEGHAHTYLECAGMIVVGLDQEGRVQHINQMASNLLGLPMQEVIGELWIDGWSPARQREELASCFERAVSDGGRAPMSFESAVLVASGGERLLEWHCAVVEGQGGEKSVWLSGVDVTERRRTERLMREQERLAELGKMSAVIAHEIKNPLTAIAGGVEILMQQLSSESSKSLGKKILSQVTGMCGVMNDLLTFAKPRRGEPVQFCMRKLLSGSLDLIKQDSRYRHLQLSLKGGSIPLEGDPQQLSQVFSNLVLNAAQAIEGEGRIDVELSKSGDECRVTILDTGTGISPAASERIFDAFFTTKLHGTGLGLAICRRFVQWHGGRIELSPRKEMGTRVDVFIPSRRNVVSQAQQSHAP